MIVKPGKVEPPKTYPPQTGKRVCPECGTDRVLRHSSFVTAVASLPFWSEDESEKQPHVHDGNCITTQFSCAKDHRWVESRKGSPCPVCGIEWLKKEPRVCFCGAINPYSEVEDGADSGAEGD